ncbi:hypothetical protein NG895_12325 [Aeoliella sp. ICT_H6.2]|uniref:Uncharacterized protein n=1 Tax=Aeoliella straminimaris TaxID=2954799 RepID=A0A9X2JG47_9BACT|nr:hypothetical protein [Aeoliella straminimaris]MCO6044695.1 hypothetical protein [Aeoliella straminimaris]
MQDDSERFDMMDRPTAATTMATVDDWHAVDEAADPREDPTPEQIAERCAEVRRGWSKNRTLKRAAWQS